MVKLIKIFVPASTLILLTISGYFYWKHQTRYPSTDDAYIQAYTVNIAPRINGKVIKVYVHNYQTVKEGQPLFAIDPIPFEIAIKKAQAELDNTQQNIDAATTAIKSAEAQVAEREAELADVREETKRTLILVKKNYLSHSQGDAAIKNLQVATAALNAAKSELLETIQKRGAAGDNNAQLRGAKAALAEAKLNLAYTEVIAPASGYIANFDLRNGTVVSAYQPVFALIENQSWWAQANFKETQINKLKAGQKAVIKIDMYPGQRFTGIVSDISNDSGTSFSLLPPENASGNWVKVTQRFPVKIIIPKQNSNYPLRLGASCTVTIDTQS